MNKTIIESAKAPAPIGPYSQAVQVGNTLYVSGQIAIDQTTGQLLTQEIKAETHQVMKNLSHILSEAGYDFSHIVKCSIFVKDLGNFAAINEVYGTKKCKRSFRIRSFFTTNLPMILGVRS